MKTVLLMVAMLVSMSIISTEAIAQEQPHNKVKATATEQSVPLKNSFICMVNDRFMGKEQIPVDVNNKTYYGCCQGCVSKLNTIRASRYAKDPLTGEEVDKAKAFAVMNPDGSGMVMYFSNEKNYKKYFNK